MPGRSQLALPPRADLRSQSRRKIPAILAGMILATTAVLAAPFSVQNPSEVQDLAVAWKFRPGDEPTWASPSFDASRWQDIRIPTGFGRDDVTSTMAWYRLTLDLSPDAPPLSVEQRADLRLGVAIGKVDSAYEIYAGGLLLGGVGKLPPQVPSMDYDRQVIYPVPAAAIGDEDLLVLALRVWKAPQTRSTVGGPHEGAFLLGPIEELTRRALVSEMPSLFLAGWFLILGVLHLAFYRRRPALGTYLWFGLLCSSFGIYAFLKTQWKYLLSDHFLLLKELEHVDLYIGLFLFIQVVWPLFGLSINRPLRGVQGAAVVAGLIVALPGLKPNLVLLFFWQLTLLCVVCGFLYMVFRQLRQGHPEARIVALGSIVVTLGILHEVGIDRGFYLGPRLADISFAFFVACLALSLSSQFARVFTEVEALRLSERSAEQANRAKSEFLANMSHEIRTPMTGILSTLDLMLEADLSPNSQEYGRIIRSSGRSLLGIIDGILDFSRIESGQVELEAVPFDLLETVTGVIELFAASAEQKGLQLHLEMPEDVPTFLVGDPLRLRQILLNLVGNGVKFTQRGTVTLSLAAVRQSEDEDPSSLQLRFTVRDTGVGIAPEILHRLFTPFTQADTSTTRRHGGTGLGLAISRRLVELMGGTFELESTPGVGSIFSFHARFALPSKEELATLEARANPSGSTGSALGKHQWTGHRVLLAEDNPVNQMVVAEQLKSRGLEVVTASDGLEAVGLLGRGTYDLVLMDCQMPELDGYEATRRIRQSEAGGQDLPIVALTASAMVGDRERCLEAGMDDYLSKPFAENELDTILERWLGSGSSRPRHALDPQPSQ